MRPTTALMLVIALLAGVTACAAQRFFAVECRGPDGAEAPLSECDEVIELVNARFGFGDAQRGTLRLVGIQTVDCADAARDEGTPGSTSRRSIGARA